MTTGPGFPHHSILEKKFSSEVTATKKYSVRKHGIAAVDAANMADIKIWCGTDSAPPKYK